MLQPGRQYSATSSYRYGFNGKENDNEVKGEGNQQDYGLRIYDPRLGRFLSVDPLSKNFPWNGPYTFAENDVIRSVDLDGLEKYVVINTYDASNRIIHKTISSVVTNDDTKNAIDMDFKRANGQDATINNVIVYDIQADGNWKKSEMSSLSSEDQELYDSYSRNRNNDFKSFSIQQGPEGFQAKKWSSEELSYRATSMVWVYPQPQIRTQQNTNQATQSLNITYVPGQAQYATPADQAAVNNIASMAPNQLIPGPVTNILGGTQQTTTNTRSTITINLQTAGANRPFHQNLLNTRYNLLRQTLINQGVPASNIRRGTSQYNVPLANMGGNENQVDFNINTTTTQRTTTVTTQPTQVIIR